MRNLIIILGVFFLLQSCVSYTPMPSPPNDILSSPPYPSSPQIFEIPKNLPQKPIVILSEEQISSTDNLKRELMESLRQRSLDGAIITHRDYASHEAGRTLASGEVTYYTQHTHFAEYLPFIYLDKVEDRAILDSISLEISAANGDLQKLSFLFDWQEQLQYLPGNLSEEHFQALAVQPWFFLLQRGAAWYQAPSQNPYFNQRRYRNGAEVRSYYPSLQTYHEIHLYTPGPNYVLWVSLDKMQRYRLDSLQYRGEVLKVERLDFFGQTISESFTMPDGTKYYFKYFYKREEDVPQEWIINPKVLQH